MLDDPAKRLNSWGPAEGVSYSFFCHTRNFTHNSLLHATEAFDKTARQILDDLGKVCGLSFVETSYWDLEVVVIDHDGEPLHKLIKFITFIRLAFKIGQ